MNSIFVFLFFFSFVVYKCICEKSEILPLGDIISGINTAAELISNQSNQTNETNQIDNNPMISEAAPKINIKVVPSKKIRITKDDMTFLLSELRQEINRQINMLEDELEEKERMRQRTSSTWSLNESPIYVPNNDESSDIMESELLKEEEQAEIDELLNSINEIAEDESNLKENRTYNIEIKDGSKSESMSSDILSNFRQRALRNGPIEQ